MRGKPGGPSLEEGDYLTTTGLSRCAGIAHLFGSRRVDSPARAGRTLGIPEDRIVTVRQVHGDAIFTVEKDGRAGNADGAGYDAILTGEPGFLIAVATADCVPILMVDRVRKVIAAVHAGWRGSLERIAQKTVGAMIGRFGCSAGSMVAAVGPSAGPCCYEVDAPVLTPLRARFPMWPSIIGEERNGRAKIDLRALNRIQLEESGIPGEQIDTVDLCTICGPERFYSYRREGRRMKSMYSGIALVQD